MSLAKLQIIPYWVAIIMSKLTFANSVTDNQKVIKSKIQKNELTHLEEATYCDHWQCFHSVIVIKFGKINMSKIIILYLT